MDYYNFVKERINGRIATYENSCNKLIELISPFPGNHVEIGTLWGGTAIMAALAKKDGHVFAIDPLTKNGYYGGQDLRGKNVTGSALLKNFDLCGVSDKITHVDDWSHPWPFAATTRFDTAFIDGDHKVLGALQDFINLEKVVDHLIIFDNYEDKAHWQVRAAVHAADEFPKWNVVYTGNNLAVLERKQDAE